MTANSSSSNECSGKHSCCGIFKIFKLISANVYELDDIIRSNFVSFPGEHHQAWFHYIRALLYHSVFNYYIWKQVQPNLDGSKLIGTFKYFSMNARFLGQTQHIIGGRVLIKHQSILNLNVHLLDR